MAPNSIEKLVLSVGYMKDREGRRRAANVGLRRKRQESNLPKTPARPPTGLKPARPTGSGTLPRRRVARFFGIVNHPGGGGFAKLPTGFAIFCSRGIPLAAAPAHEPLRLRLAGDRLPGCSGSSSTASDGRAAWIMRGSAPRSARVLPAVWRRPWKAPLTVVACVNRSMPLAPVPTPTPIASGIEKITIIGLSRIAATAKAQAV